MNLLISNIVNRLLFTAAVLVPVTAYAANPSAVFTDEVVSAGSNPIACGTPVGAAAADVAAVGYNTCAFYSDFTTPIPNTVGTGLPQNWLNCDSGSTTPATWYWGSYPEYYGGNYDTNPCLTGGVNSSTPPSASNSQIFQTTDPVYGGYALEIQALANPACSTTPQLCDNDIGTVDTAGLSPAPQPGQFGFSYIEFMARTDNPSGGLNQYQNLAVTEWTTDPENERNGYPGTIEIDHLEQGQNQFDVGIHFWSCVSGCSGPTGITNGSYTDTAYHTWGLLFIGDGSNNLITCSYKDGTKLGCVSDTSVGSAMQNNRHYVGSVIAKSNGTTATNNYWKYFKVWTCTSGVNGSTPSQLCSVSPWPPTLP